MNFEKINSVAYTLMIFGTIGTIVHKSEDDAKKVTPFFPNRGAKKIFPIMAIVGGMIWVATKIAKEIK